MIIQMKEVGSANFEIIRKTINKNVEDFRLVNQWNEEGKDVNLIAKSLYNH
jgi:hypothetical protein